ncbi:MAG: gliding motility-associated C-terminal domain-containing protein [Bacteroidota bacterium]|nr:gliding motility-associated C-terminal domain-containing protein [Bacteroidota bacterium]
MRNKLSAFLIIFSVITISLKSQNKVIKLSKEDYSRLKSEGSIDYNKYTYEIELKGDNAQANKIKPVKNNSVLSGNIACNIIDQSTVPAVSFGGDIEVDDESVLIDIPFTFCFYGTNYGDFYLNSNGNITFGSQFTGFTASGFPTTGPRMIAPFWADFDNRPNNNGVARISITSTAAIITWDSMGYYNQQSDKRNTCQLIITEGTDPILPAGYNVGFLYENMDWTTGSASSGTNGFGGTAATVGINQGDGATFVQVGRFDSPGGAFVSNTATNSGIDWLDYKVFFFNICTSGGSTNIAPIASNISFCDTIKICNPTDTLYLSSQFFAPEPSQTNTITVTCATLPATNLQVVYGTPGSTSDVQVKIFADPSLLGYHIIDYRSIDNGSPADTTIVSQVIYILNDPSFQPSIVMPVAPVCSANAPFTVSIGPNCADYTSFLWMDDTTTCTHTFSNIMPTINKMNVTVKGLNGCQRTLFDSLKIYPNPVPTINGPLFYCGTAGTDLNATYTPLTSTITNYAWDVPGSTSASTVHVSNPGAVNLIITDNIGCTGSASVTVSNAVPAVTISQNPTTFCPGTPVTLTASVAGATSYNWTGGASGTTQSVVVTGPSVPTNCAVTALVSGCNTSSSITLTPLPAVTLSFINPEFCAGEADTIKAIANPSNADVVWNPGGIIANYIAPPIPGQTYTVQATAPGGGLCPSATETVTAYFANPLPNIGSIVDDELDPYNTILCYKDKKKLLADNITSGTPPFTYAWSPLSSSNDTLTITQPGEYFLYLTDSKGCKDKDSITVVLNQPTIALVGNPLICRGEDTARIVVIGNSTNSFTISWDPANLGTNDTVYATTSGTYSVTITDDVYGCTATQPYSVNYFPEPVANFTDEPDSVSEWQVPVLFQNTSTITGGTLSVVSWYFGDGDTTLGGNLQIHDYATPGDYPVTLIVKSNKGCYDTVTVNHLVEVHLPLLNIITPNGDNINQKLNFRGLEFFEENKITIFNRWGKKVYEKNNYDNNFDGADLESGTYYYILEVKGHRPESVLSSFFQIIK